MKILMGPLLVKIWDRKVDGEVDRDKERERERERDSEGMKERKKKRGKEELWDRKRRKEGDWESCGWLESSLVTELGEPGYSIINCWWRVMIGGTIPPSPHHRGLDCRVDTTKFRSLRT